MYGWHGKLLRVNLTSQTITEEDLPVEILRDYLGGRGLGVRLLSDVLPPGTDPLGPENPLIWATGALTGTKTPTAGRFSLTTKSPLTGTILDTNSGGRWGARCKATGYDALVVEGRAAAPVYLLVEEGRAELRDANWLWGMDVPGTTSALADQLGQDVSVACIGPAGENMVLMAAIINDRTRALGRGGAGAVMGAKNLKAVVVRGKRQPAVADPETYDFLLYESTKQINANPITSQGLPEFGTAALVNIMNTAGAFPARNFQASVFEGAERISGEALLEQFVVRKTACWGCPIACARVTRTPAGREGEGPEYESIWALGALCGIDDLSVIVEANHLCNDLGLDTISTGSTIACAMELRQRGIADAGVEFGQSDRLLEMIKKIAHREGVGDELAVGSRRYAAKYDAGRYAMQVKGLELPAYDPRCMQGQGLLFATSNRGACHLRGNMLGHEILGSPKMVDRFAHAGKAGLVIVHQNFSAAVDSLVLCKFVTFALAEEFLARLLRAVTGIDYQAQDLQVIGERIWNLERLFNLGEGFGRLDDTLPARLLEEPVAEGPARGRVVELAPMLDEFYRFRGWTPAGVPTEKKLRQLGLTQEKVHADITRKGGTGQC